jgi:hypothetical protein
MKELLKELEKELEKASSEYKWRSKLKNTIAGEKAISFNDGIITCLTDVIRRLKRHLKD